MFTSVNYVYNIFKLRKIWLYPIKNIKFVASSYTNKCDDTLDIFVGTKDKYNGITLCFKSLQVSGEYEFSEKLKNSLKKWKTENINGVWFDIPLEYSNFIPILIKHSFLFHHVNCDGHGITMHSWLRQDMPSVIPRYAHTMIGVGAVVINAKEQILVVSERVNSQIWKLPGGYVESNEDIDAAAKREVLEETGIETSFDSVILFRHVHNFIFHCSDIYFIVKLNPISSTISKDIYEIHNCIWMNISDFLNNAAVSEMNKYFLQTMLKYNMYSLQIEKQNHFHPVLKKPYCLYNIKLGSQKGKIDS